MEAHIDVQPLPYKSRQRTFGLLFVVFLTSLPFLYLYATGYRFDFERPTNIVSTGGIYLAVEKTGAEIFVDNELVRETRTFRKAFYAQSLDVGTHRVHVQKDGFHTWVKELPVSKHRVTEAEAFNLPLVPQVRTIAEWYTATGTMVVPYELTYASSTNSVIATTTRATSTLIHNQEFISLIKHFSSSSDEASETSASQLRTLLQGKATTTVEQSIVATTTIVRGGAKLYESDGNIFATWVGSFEEMPYYYCAPDFPPYSIVDTATSNEEIIEDILDDDTLEEQASSEGVVVHPVQTIPKDVVCDQTIHIDRMGQKVQDFDFFLGTTDFVVLALDQGIYVVEVDDRSWQNAQPLFLGQNLSFHIENGNIFVYDGSLIYQVAVTLE